MAGNHTNEKKTGKNGQHNHAHRPEHKAVKKTGHKNGRGTGEKAATANVSERKKVGAESGGGRKANGRSGSRAPSGALFAIGGAEDRHDTKVILNYLAERIGSGKLVISTLASEYGDEVWEVYRKLFVSMGVKHIKHMGINHRDETTKDPRLDMMADAKAVFFTGGDQFKITSRLGGTALSELIEEIYRRGGIIGGTSAGATALGEMMLVGLAGEGICKVKDVHMTPGLGLARNMIIDQHFSERGRIRRLLGAVAQNPRMLGVGIDEDTAVVIESDGTFQTLGSGAVYVVDGHDLNYTNISQVSFSRALSVFGVKLHALSSGDSFDIHSRRPEHAAISDEESEAEFQLIKEEID
ncbi:MAG: cyanophycinase [Chloracidobacterium sp.]|nr:cyanophycinase [Chloracidobacterium sp.]